MKKEEGALYSVLTAHSGELFLSPQSTIYTLNTRPRHSSFSHFRSSFFFFFFLFSSVLLFLSKCLSCGRAFGGQHALQTVCCRLVLREREVEEGMNKTKDPPTVVQERQRRRGSRDPPCVRQSQGERDTRQGSASHTSFCFLLLRLDFACCVVETVVVWG